MVEVSKELAEAFQALYSGRTDVWGSVEGLCNKETVTLEYYAKHLLGGTSLGIYPLLNDGTCHFFAVDLAIGSGADCSFGSGSGSGSEAS